MFSYAFNKEMLIQNLSFQNSVETKGSLKSFTIGAKDSMDQLKGLIPPEDSLLPVVSQGCHIGFLKAKFYDFSFFSNLPGLENLSLASFLYFGLFLAFLNYLLSFQKFLFQRSFGVMMMHHFSKLGHPWMPYFVQLHLVDTKNWLLFGHAL